MPSKRAILRNFNRAKGVSKCSDFSRQKLGCVFVEGNKVIATGYNTTKTNPLQKKYNEHRNFPDGEARNNGAVHAEMMCVLKTRYLDVNWANVSAYIYRATQAGDLALAKPCPGCLKAMQDLGIINIYYTTEEGYEKYEQAHGV